MKMTWLSGARLVDDILIQLGIGGVFALLVLEKVFTFMRGRRSEADEVADIKEFREECRVAFATIAELHSWHDKEDGDGIKVWYIRRSLEESIEKLAAAVEAMAANSVAHTAVIENQSRDHQRILDTLARQQTENNNG